MGERRNLHCDRCGKMVVKDHMGKDELVDEGWQSIQLRLPIQKDGEFGYTHFCGKCYEVFYTMMFRFLDKKFDKKMQKEDIKQGKKSQDFYHGKID